MKFLKIDSSTNIKQLFSGKAIVKEHMHIWRKLDEYELFFVTEGELFIEQENIKYSLKKGDYFISEKNQPYGGFKNSSGVFHWLHFSCQEDLFRSSKEEKSKYSIAQTGHIENFDTVIIAMILLEQYSCMKNRAQPRNDLTRTILIDLYAATKESAEETCLKDKKFQTVIEYMATNPFFNEFKNVKTMAEYFGYSEKYLIRLFKKNMNISPMQYFISRKLLRAQEMLADTDTKIKSIATTLNFDYYYFMRLFKDKTGMTPTEYRKAITPNWNNY